MLWRNDTKDFEKRVKSAWNCWKGSDLDQFCLVRSAHCAGIHVSVCVVACFVCQNQWICELNIMRRSHSLSVCVHASGDLQVDWVVEVTVHCCCSILGVRFRPHGLVRPVLKHGPRSLDMCASLRVLNLQAQWKWMLGYVHLQLTVILRVVWVRAHRLGPERWWTMPEKGKVRWNSGGGSQRYWRANRSLYLGIGAKYLVAGSLRNVPQENWSWITLSGKANDWRNRKRFVLNLFSNFKWVRSSDYSGEPLGQVTTLRGPFLVSRTGDEGWTKHWIKVLAHQIPWRVLLRFNSKTVGSWNPQGSV